MTKAIFYYEVPLTDNPDGSFFQRFFEYNLGDSRELICNVNSLVSKLDKAQKELSGDPRWETCCKVFHFPVFNFNIDSTSYLYLASEKLFEITTPIFPHLVRSNREGYNILERVLKNNYAGRLEKNVLGGRKIIIPKH